MKLVRSVLNMPQEVIPLNVIPVGVPSGEDKQKIKYNKEKIHCEQW
jgi:hypothetical protein